jgi:hypothetical protein
METTTECRIVIEGIKMGTPFRESSSSLGVNQAQELMQHYGERITNPPGSFNDLNPTILRAELRTRQVTPWTTTQAVGHEPIVDACDRQHIHDQGSLKKLRQWIATVKENFVAPADPS